jgi:hypothetical protein
MAYYPPRSVLPKVPGDTGLESKTSIELLRLTYDGGLGKAILDVRDTFGDDILEHVTAPADYGTHECLNIQLLQVFSPIQAK